MGVTDTLHGSPRSEFLAFYDRFSQGADRSSEALVAALAVALGQ